jgi:hypothetical protein
MNHLEWQCHYQINRHDPETPGKYSGILASWCLGDLAVKSLFPEGKDLRVSSTRSSWRFFSCVSWFILRLQGQEVRSWSNSTFRL